MIIFASLDNSPNDNAFIIVPMFTSSLLAARTWRGALHMRPVSTSFIARDLPTACAAFVIVPMFTGSLLAARTWRGALYMCPVSTCFIARDLPTACAGAL